MNVYLLDAIRFFLTLLVFLIGFFVSLPIVQADNITYQYEGELTEVDSPLEGEFSVGDSFTGSLTFNTAWHFKNGDGFPEEFGFGIFGNDLNYPNAVTALSFSSGTYTTSISSDANTSSEITSGVYQDFPLCSPDDSYCYLFLFGMYFRSATGLTIEGFSPSSMDLEWFYTGHYTSNHRLFYLSLDPGFDPDYRSQPHESFSLGFKRVENQFAIIKGKLNSVTMISSIPSLTVPDNTWVQIGLNTVPSTENTVDDILGDDISAPYDVKWVVYSYQTDTNTYKKLSLTDVMLPGEGYWLIQLTGKRITIDMPNESTDVNVVQSPACATTTVGCFEIPLAVNDTDIQWQMIAYPFRTPRAIRQLRIVTNAGSCLIGCTLIEANAEGIVSDSLWHYDATSYKQLTRNFDKLEPWDGAWIAILPSAKGLAPKLLIPALPPNN